LKFNIIAFSGINDTTSSEMELLVLWGKLNLLEEEKDNIKIHDIYIYILRERERERERERCIVGGKHHNG
jgi:hypothetical protein